MLNSESFYRHDFCARFRTWDDEFARFRLPLSLALSQSLDAAIAANSAETAYDHFMSLAVKPGLELSSENLYPVAIHHARLIEVLAAYALSVESSLPSPIEMPWGEYQPAFLMPDGRLRRVVIAERWDQQREGAERMSWRTVADTAVTNRPMLITALVIGRAEKGFRHSPWALGFRHPANGSIRVERREGKFEDSWERCYRENTDLKPLEWLGIMQSDGSFEGRVISFIADPPRDKDDILRQMATMRDEMKADSLRQTRSSCFKLRPCPFASACLSGQSPDRMGWTRRESLVDLQLT